VSGADAPHDAASHRRKGVNVGRRLVGVVGIGLLLGVAGCSESIEVKDAEQMSGALLEVDDLEGTWKLNVGSPGPDEETLPESGILSDKQRELMPTLDLCDAAPTEAKKAADTLKWVVFRQLDKTVDDPLDPPTDRSGHMVFVQESMISEEPEVLSETFDALVLGTEACLGEIPAGEEGAGSSAEVTIEDVGDQQIAVLTEIEEAGGVGMWHIYTAIVRKGSVLVSLMAADVVLGDLPAELQLEDFDRIVQSALEKL
jgi:hypothetical protein